MLRGTLHRRDDAVSTGSLDDRRGGADGRGRRGSCPRRCRGRKAGEVSPDEADSAYDVEFRSVTKRFGSLTAVDNVSLQVKKGEFLSLLGPSGCGKTTSLRMIAGFEQPDEGEILIGGIDA